MPQQIALVAIPNQQFTVVLDNLYYGLRFRTLKQGPLICDVTRAGVAIISGNRVLHNQLILPYPYMEGAGGNFVLDSALDLMPDYTLFGTSQQLIYFSAAEMLAMRNDA